MIIEVEMAREYKRRMKMSVGLIFTPYIGIFVLIFFMLINGCASTGKKPKTTEGTASLLSEEVPTEVKINEFILGPGDKIEIIVYRHDDLKRILQIDTSGKITYPLVGDIQAGGLGIFQLRDRIRDGLLKYIIDPQVSIGVTTVQSQKVVVLGEVNNPGLFNLDSPLTSLEAISKAGGFTSQAKKKSVLLIRGGLKSPELMTLNVERALKEGNMTHNVVLRRDDIIYVPRTFIADVDKFFTHLSTIISPLLSAEVGYFIGRQISLQTPTTTVPVIPTK
jgi:polysaccharide export outer membrane protein